MNQQKLREAVKSFQQTLKNDPDKAKQYLEERRMRLEYYQSWTCDRILKMTEDEMIEYLSKLWAMLTWGDAPGHIQKVVIPQNGLDNLRKSLAELIWGEGPIEKRWDRFRKSIKYLGPASMSELLCFTFPDDFIIWNRRARFGLDALEVENVPSHDYQVTGKCYKELCEVIKEIRQELHNAGMEGATLLTVDYFIYDEFPMERESPVYKKAEEADQISTEPKKESEFKHNDIRDKIAEIGNLLGFESKTEVKVADGSKVDATWEVQIGNMGRVIYVFEVQTHGSIDSLILNLLKSILKNSSMLGLTA